MREPPTELSESTVLALVRAHWSSEIDRVEHLPVGFGAHHWQALAGFRPMLFVTYDTLGARHTPESLEAAYASAAELAFALDFVVAGLASDTLDYIVPVARGALSVTPWVNGILDEPAEADQQVRMLTRLHAAHPPARLPRWAPVVGVDLADRLAERLATAWTAGPQAARAQAALRAHLDDVRGWVARYHRRASSTSDRSWVVTHGEPHAGNVVVTPVRTLLVDWESVRLAPRERDLREHTSGADPEMLELFDLEWRLDEISQYAEWFEGPHIGTADDEIALDGLLEELARP